MIFTFFSAGGRRVASTVLFAALTTAALHAAESPTPHAFLHELCDDFGGRLTGSPGNVEAMKRLEKALRDLGVTTQRQTFSMPGWGTRRGPGGLANPSRTRSP